MGSFDQEREYWSEMQKKEMEEGTFTGYGLRSVSERARRGATTAFSNCMCMMTSCSAARYLSNGTKRQLGDDDGTKGDHDVILVIVNKVKGLHLGFRPEFVAGFKVMYRSTDDFLEAMECLLQDVGYDINHEICLSGVLQEHQKFPFDCRRGRLCLERHQQLDSFAEFAVENP